MLKSCETLASELSPVHHLQQIWHFARSETLTKESLSVGDLSTTAWRSTIFETVTYFEVVVAEQGMAVDPPERDERERRPREERAIGSARCNLLQYLFMYFSLYIIYIPHICISVHLLPGTHISLAQVGPAGSRVGWSAVLQARALLCKPGDSVTLPD